MKIYSIKLKTTIFCGALSIINTSFAWETKCEVDDFSDQKECIIRDYQSGSEHVISIGAIDENKGEIFISYGDLNESYYQDNKFIIRIDDKNSIDLADQTITQGTRNSINAALTGDLKGRIIEQMKYGKTLRVRASTISGGQTDASVSLSGFSSAWEVFNESHGSKQ